MKSPRCSRLYILLRGPVRYYKRPFPFPRANLAVWRMEFNDGHRAYCGCDLP